MPSDYQMQQEATQLGIPYVIPIGDEIRHAGCNAREAQLADISPDHLHVRYSGVCANQHRYEIEMQVKDLQKEQVVEEEEEDFELDEEGKLSIGGKGTHEATELEEY